MVGRLLGAALTARRMQLCPPSSAGHHCRGWGSWVLYMGIDSDGVDSGSTGRGGTWKTGMAAVVEERMDCGRGCLCVLGMWAYSDVTVITASRHCGCWVVCIVASLPWFMLLAAWAVVHSSQLLKDGHIVDDVRMWIGVARDRGGSGECKWARICLLVKRGGVRLEMWSFRWLSALLPPSWLPWFTLWPAGPVVSIKVVVVVDLTLWMVNKR